MKLLDKPKDKYACKFIYWITEDVPDKINKLLKKNGGEKLG